MTTEYQDVEQIERDVFAVITAINQMYGCAGIGQNFEFDGKKIFLPSAVVESLNEITKKLVDFCLEHEGTQSEKTHILSLVKDVFEVHAIKRKLPDHLMVSKDIQKDGATVKKTTYPENRLLEYVDTLIYKFKEYTPPSSFIHSYLQKQMSPSAEKSKKP